MSTSKELSSNSNFQSKSYHKSQSIMRETRSKSDYPRKGDAYWRIVQRIYFYHQNFNPNFPINSLETVHYQDLLFYLAKEKLNIPNIRIPDTAIFNYGKNIFNYYYSENGLIKTFNDVTSDIFELINKFTPLFHESEDVAGIIKEPIEFGDTLISWETMMLSRKEFEMKIGTLYDLSKKGNLAIMQQFMLTDDKFHTLYRIQCRGNKSPLCFVIRKRKTYSELEFRNWIVDPCKNREIINEIQSGTNYNNLIKVITHIRTYLEKKFQTPLDTIVSDFIRSHSGMHLIGFKAYYYKTNYKKYQDTKKFGSRKASLNSSILQRKIENINYLKKSLCSLCGSTKLTDFQLSVKHLKEFVDFLKVDIQ